MYLAGTTWFVYLKISRNLCEKSEMVAIFSHSELVNYSTYLQVVRHLLIGNTTTLVCF